MNHRQEPLLQLADLVCGMCGDVVDGHDPLRFELVRDFCVAFDRK
jgi:hypothetical protein